MNLSQSENNTVWVTSDCYPPFFSRFFKEVDGEIVTNIQRFQDVSFWEYLIQFAHFDINSQKFKINKDHVFLALDITPHFLSYANHAIKGTVSRIMLEINFAHKMLIKYFSAGEWESRNIICDKDNTVLLRYVKKGKEKSKRLYGLIDFVCSIENKKIIDTHKIEDPALIAELDRFLSYAKKLMKEILPSAYINENGIAFKDSWECVKALNVKLQIKP